VRLLNLPHRNLHRWLTGYLSARFQGLSAEPFEGPRHLLVATCDHYEPLWGGATTDHGWRRVERWLTRYEKMAEGLRDADGRPPRHSFFFPGEQYRPEYLAALGELARAGFGEVELHLHHDADDADKLTRDILRYLELFAEHGHLSRAPDGRLRYGFIHGNWCLANSRRDGRWCGVDSELGVLFDTGCYADFTFPSAPDETQPNIVNQIYWPTGDPQRARAHERGVRARVGQVMDDRILMIQGPLGLALREDKRALRIDGAALTAKDPGTRRRIDTWLSQGVQLQGRPEWTFVKLHTHGAPDEQAESLLGAPGRRMHEILTSEFNDGQRFVLHYVTAREMFNIALAGMHGFSGNPGMFRDFSLSPPPVFA
jgi:hypothetical protein